MRCGSVWPSGQGFRLVGRRTSVGFRFVSLLSPKVVVSVHCLVTLSLAINQTVKVNKSITFVFPVIVC